jgi:hypothetical protein
MWSSAKLGETPVARSPGSNLEVDEPVRIILAAQSEPGITEGLVGSTEVLFAMTKSRN